MAEPKITLTARPALSGLPKQHGAMTLDLVDPGPLTTIAPYAGKVEAVSQALEKAHGLALPATGTLTTSGSTGLQWFARDIWLLSGAVPGAGLSAHAALTDQSDGWAVFDLTGPDGAAVMARLTPVDLRLSACPVGTALRTEAEHMMVAITRTAPNTLRIIGFRSMATSLAHAIETAMARVAAG